MRRTVVLAILDGWGLGASDQSNPIYIAQPPTISFIERSFQAAALQASGIAVGLPWGEEGNSEVGHLTIGAGKTLYQYFPRISLAIRNKTFAENDVLQKAFLHARKNSSAVHLIGLLSESNVHSSQEHIFALIDLAKKEKISKLFLHIFSDGRDSAPKSVEKLLEILNVKLSETGIGSVVNIAGRYYAMNRDEHWDRTERVYQLLTNDNTPIGNLHTATKATYDKGLNDEYIEPVALNGPHPIQSNDSVVFFNFREDSIRQIVTPFVEPLFSRFTTKKLENVYIATMTQYHESFVNANVAFPPEQVTNPLGRVLATSKKTQLRVAETQKYAHVTYFFNGLRDEPFPDEYRILIPSSTPLKIEENPGMMARSITDRVLSALGGVEFDFILVNYPNPDVIAHTGNYDATVAAIKIVDRELERLTKAVLAGDHIMLVTSDHGNAEKVLDLTTGEIETQHNASPVPIYLVGNECRLSSPRPPHETLQVIGILADIAPTILAIMGISKPHEMTGESLLGQLK